MTINDGIRELLTPRRILFLLMFLGIALRVGMALSRPMIMNDETVYVHMAEALVEQRSPEEITGIISTNFLPLLPVFIAMFSLVLGDYVLSGYFVVILFSALALYPVFHLGKEIAGERVGLMAAALLTFAPLFVDYSSRIYTESAFIFFLVLGVLFSKHMLSGCRIPCSILAGASLGFAYLLNPVAVVYILIILVLAVIVGLKRGTWWPMLRAMAVMIFCFLIYAIPFIFFLHNELDRWVYSGKNPGLLYAAEQGLENGTMAWEREMLRLTDDGDEIFVFAFSGEKQHDPLTKLLIHPKTSVQVFQNQLQLFYQEKLPTVFPVWLLPLMGLGLFGYRWSKRQALDIGYLLLMIAPMALLLTLASIPRHFTPFIPFALIIVAMGWARLEQWADETIAFTSRPGGRRRLARYARPAIAAAVILPMILYSLVLNSQAKYPTDYRQAGEWIRSEYGEDQWVMSREFSTAFYADSHVVVFPYDDYGRTVDFAASRDVDLLVATRKELIVDRPEFAQLLKEGTRSAEWELVHTIGAGTGEETYVFEFHPERSGGTAGARS